MARLYYGDKIGWNKFLVRERNLGKLGAMFHSRCLFPILNFSLFSGLLVCELVIQRLLNPWMLGLCAIGAVGNLYWAFVVFQGEPSELPGEKIPRSEEKSAIMCDLDKEIERRREIEKVEKN
ncbi:MAG: hypothetical protein HN531_08725 [Opitutae bacterium]|nr:hypothetical protein [Opitutae bacterium]